MPENKSKRLSTLEAEEADGDSIDSFLRAAAGDGTGTRRELHRAVDRSLGDKLAVGQVVAQRYRLEQIIGTGGMGVIWSALHEVTGRRVALKFLKGSAHLDEGFRRRFMREARATTAVRHPNVVEILDWFELDDAVPVIVMELLHGETLAKRLSRGRLGPEETATVLIPVLSAVGTAHSLGIVHRDLKPENIFLADDGRAQPVKVLDFGIAKLLQPVDAQAATESGTTLGTPCYMAPEQVLAERDLDHRCDIWALGAIAYECLAGVRAVAGFNIAHAAVQLTGPGVTSLARRAPGLHPELAALVDAMTARDRELRPSLRAVSLLLARYTAVRAADFAEPRTLASASRPNPPPASEVEAGVAEPRAPVVSDAEARPRRVRWKPAAVLLLSVGLAFSGLLALQRGWGASRAPAPAARAQRSFAGREPVLAASEPRALQLSASSESGPTPESSTKSAPEPEPRPPGVPAPQRVRTRPPQAASASSTEPARPVFRGGLAEEVPF